MSKTKTLSPEKKMADLQAKIRQEAAELPAIEKEFATLQAELQRIEAMPEARSSLIAQDRIREIVVRQAELGDKIPTAETFNRAAGIGDFRALMALANEMATEVKGLFVVKEVQMEEQTGETDAPITISREVLKSAPNGQVAYRITGLYNRVIQMAIEGKNVEAEPLSKEEVARRRDARSLHVVPYHWGLHAVPGFAKPAIKGFVQLVWAAYKRIRTYEDALREYRDEQVKTSSVPAADVLVTPAGGHTAFWFYWDEGGKTRRRYLDIETDGKSLTVRDATGGAFARFIGQSFPVGELPSVIFAALKKTAPGLKSPRPKGATYRPFADLLLKKEGGAKKAPRSKGAK